MKNPPPLKAWLRFFRWKNLSIVALSMYLLRWLVLFPVLEKEAVAFYLSEIQFAGLVLATVLVTLGGYVINDYHDVEIDLINKKKRTFIGRYLSRKAAFQIFLFSQIFGFFLAFFIAYFSKHLPWIWLYPASVAALWLYAAELKKRPLLGNLWVALFTAGVPLLVLFAERESLAAISSESRHKLLFIFYFYALFAFLTNWYREIIKDLEDFKGDFQQGLRTMPIAWGKKISHYFLYFISLLVFLNLMYFFQYFQHFELWFMGTLGVFLPLIYNLYFLHFRAKKASDYHHLSNITKIIMLVGLLLLLALR